MSAAGGWLFSEMGMIDEAHRHTSEVTRQKYEN